MRRLLVTMAALSCVASAMAEPPGKPEFLQQGNNADVAYCFVVLKDSKYRANPRDWNLTVRYLSRAAYLSMILEERAGEKWPSLRDEIMQWTTKAIEEDLATKRAPFAFRPKSASTSSFPKAPESPNKRSTPHRALLTWACCRDPVAAAHRSTAATSPHRRS